MIIIVGDSWGVGEWGVQDNNYCLTGPGFGQYLMLHDQVINLSVGAGSNAQALDRLASFLSRYRPNEYDEFYWIVTDPKRCVDITEVVDTTVGLEEKLKHILSKSIDLANSIATTHNIKLKAIGGLCDLNQDWYSHCNNLELVVPSWGKLVDASYVDSILCHEKWADIGELVKQKRPELLEEWLQLSELIEAKQKTMWKVFGNRNYHPDQSAHLAIKNYLYPEHTDKF